MILLDVDGVLADFTTGIASLLECPWYGTFEDPPRDWELYEHMQVDADYVDDQLIRAGSGFWRGLPMFPWARTIIELIGLRPWAYCTSPMRTPDSLYGRLQWIQDFHPHDYFMCGAEKDIMARPDNLLIDDRDLNIERFVAAGGQGFLWPMPWNAGRDRFDRTGRRQLNELSDFLNQCSC